MILVAARSPLCRAVGIPPPRVLGPRGATPSTVRLRLEAGREVLLRGGSVGFSPSYSTRLYGAWYGHSPSEEVPRRPAG